MPGRCWTILLVVAIGCSSAGQRGHDRPRREVVLGGRDKVIPVDIKVTEVGGKDEWTVELHQVVDGTPTDSTPTIRDVDVLVLDESRKVLVRLPVDDPRYVYVDEPQRDTPSKRRRGDSGTVRVFLEFDRAIRFVQLKGRRITLDQTFSTGGQPPKPMLLVVPHGAATTPP